MPKTDYIQPLAVGLVAPMVEDFLEKAGADWSPTRLGREACKDPSRVFRIREGREIRTSTAVALIAVMDSAVPGFSTAFVNRHLRRDTHAKKKHS
jgi:hypothetical protein